MVGGSRDIHMADDSFDGSMDEDALLESVKSIHLFQPLLKDLLINL